MGASSLAKWDRRAFLVRTSVLGATGLLGLFHGGAAAEPPPETSKIRLVHAPYICLAPQYLAEEFFRMEGFADWEYLPLGTRVGINALAEGRADISMWSTPELIYNMDLGK